MRLRTVTLTDGGTSTAVHDAERDRWVPLVPALAAAAGDDAALAAGARDLVAFLAGGAAEREAAVALLDGSAGEDFAASFDPAPRLPFQPRTLRAFSLYERHQIQAARGLVRRYLPKVFPLATRYESLTGRTFPPLKPKPLFYAQPIFYMGNPLTFHADGAPVPWPSYSRDLDYELELGAILASPVAPDTPAREAEAAVGGFVVVNDVSARDTQWREFREGVFGPVVKAKTFANTMGAEVVTADEILPRIESLAGKVTVNGEVCSRTSTAGMQHSLGAMVAHASAGEPLQPGELLSTGTLPNGCGLELDRWIRPGDEVELALDGVGSVRNRIG